MTESPETIIDIEKQLDVVGAQAYNLRMTDPNQAAEMCEAVIAEATKQTSHSRQFQNLLAHVQIVLSLIYIQLARYNRALVQALEAQVLYENIEHSYGQARSLNAIGLVHLYLSNFPEALENFLAGVALTESTGDQRYRAAILNNIGLLYFEMEDFEAALNYLNESLALSREINLLEWQGDALQNLCDVHLQMGNLDEALSCGMESISLLEKVENNYGLTETYNSIGEVYAAKGDHRQALNFYYKALHLGDSIPHHKQVVDTLYRIGRLHQSLEQKGAALESLNKALSQAKELGLKQEIYRCHQVLAEVYKGDGEHEKALEHYEKFYAAREEVLSESTGKRLKSLEVMHQVERAKKDAEITQLKNVELQKEIDERKKVQTKLEQLTKLDPLTGIFNRRHFFEMAEKELERSERFNRPISVIMLDIDHFKQVNDEHGHLVGDEVLKEVSKRIMRGLRTVDVACRYGGEEFAVLLPETDLTQGKQVAQRLWAEIVARPTDTSKLTLMVGISLGVACKQPKDKISIDVLLDRADQALYMAKNAGRNRVMIYPEAGEGKIA